MRRYFDIVVVVVVARKEEIEEGEVTIILSLFIIKMMIGRRNETSSLPQS
jgi:hypothetical protein